MFIWIYTKLHTLIDEFYFEKSIENVKNVSGNACFLICVFVHWTHKWLLSSVGQYDTV